MYTCCCKKQLCSQTKFSLDDDSEARHGFKPKALFTNNPDYTSSTTRLGLHLIIEMPDQVAASLHIPELYSQLTSKEALIQ